MRNNEEAGKSKIKLETQEVYHSNFIARQLYAEKCLN